MKLLLVVLISFGCQKNQTEHKHTHVDTIKVYDTIRFYSEERVFLEDSLNVVQLSMLHYTDSILTEMEQSFDELEEGYELLEEIDSLFNLEDYE